MLFIMLFIPLNLLACGSKSESTYIAKIISVHDGDTFTDSAGNIYRLYGVDTPETSDQYNGFRPTAGLEAQFGNAARRYAENLINLRHVKIHKKTVDKYHRVVASAEVDGKDLATELVKNGLARVAYIDVQKGSIYYTNDFDYYKQLLRAQHFAYEHNKGVWAFKNKLKEIFPKAVHI